MTIRKVKRRGETRLVVDIVYKRKDGAQGRYRHDAEVQTMAAARAEERRILANIVQFGEPFVPKPEVLAAEEKVPIAVPTFNEMVETFLATKAVTALKPTTRIVYEEILETWLLPAFGKRLVDTIGYEDASQLDAAMVKEELSPSRRRNVLVVLRSVLREATEAGKLPEFPKLPPLPRVGKTILKTLRREDVTRLLAVASARIRLAFALSAYAGLRAGEVRALRWADVDLAVRTITVRRARSRGIESTPKSGHERAIPIAPQLFGLLEEASPKTGLVALNMDGEPWGEFGLLLAFQRAAKKAGVRGFRFHDLRHFFVTALFRGGAPAPAVQALAGHADITTTSRYAHLVQADLRDAVARLG